MAAKGAVGERAAEGPNKKPRRETQISMNGKDAGIPEEKPESYSRDSGRNLPRVECCERPTITAKREDSTQETASLMEAVLERENMKVAYARVVSNKGAPGERPRSIPQETLAANQRRTVGGKIPTESGETSRNTQAGWRSAKAWHSYGDRSTHPTSPASSAQSHL